jgi:putative DNA primase/helicase
MSLIVPDPLVRAEIDDFDKNVSLFNVRNGTYDFSIGKLRPHQAEDMLTKVANVDHVPEAGCPVFLKVLGQSLPDEHADFLLRYLGYALQGDPKEQVFAILHGAGANGKSTVINAVSYLLGDYVANVEPSTLIKQKSERVRTDIARLHGVHLAVTSELATGEILDAPLVKRLTGNDLITARALYSSEFEFKPKFSLVMTTNALPVIDGADDALTRRIILIPFSNVVPEAERDSTLNSQLKSEASGIFNLLLIGLQDYHEQGLAIPDDIREERSRYAASSDMLASFLSDETVEDDAGTAKAADLYNRYRHWCGMSGLRCLSSPQFKRELIKKGYESKRSSSGNAWLGLRLRKPHQ